jgi:hypothetical protein
MLAIRVRLAARNAQFAADFTAPPPSDVSDLVPSRDEAARFPAVSRD